MSSCKSFDSKGTDAILELIKCPICLEIYTDPRMLPCQHSFCLCCLERLAENDGRYGRCPQCRQLFRIPFSGVSSFDVNRTIVQLLETFPKQQIERPALRAKCASCRNEDLITTCEHCKEALCKSCRTSHFNELKSDINKQLTTIESESDKLLVKEVESISKHELNLLKCKEIKQFIQKKVGDLIQQIKDEETKLMDDVEDFERLETNLLADMNNRLKELENMTKFSSISNKILLDKEEIDCEIMNINENCEKYGKLLKEFHKDVDARHTTRRISFFNRDVPASFSLGYVETVISQNENFSFSSEEDAAPSPFDTLEAQLIDIPPRKNPSAAKKCRTSSSSSSLAKSQSKVSRYKSIVEPRKLTQPYRIVGLEGEENSEFKHPLGVAVSPIDGNIFVADSWNNRLQIFDENGHFVRAIDKIYQNEFRYPYSIHIDKKGRIYVSDQSLIRIKVFDYDAKLNDFKLIRVIGRYGREVGCYSGLCDLCTDADNNIYVCDSGNHRILKFSESGEFLMQWGSNGSNEGYFKCPACVTVHDNRVFVSDWGNHRVQVFTLEGKFISQIGKHGVGPGEFKRPLGLAVDERGNLAVVDEGNNRLQIFRSDLSYHSQISALKTVFQRPWDVAITKHGGIVVSEYYGHRLQIF